MDDQAKQIPQENLMAQSDAPVPEKPDTPINIMPSSSTPDEAEKGNKIFSKRNLIIGFAVLAVVIVVVGSVLGVKAKGEYQGFIKKVESETQRIEQENKVRAPSPSEKVRSDNPATNPASNKVLQPQPSGVGTKALQDQPR
ncbi:hypothetical protein HZC20_03450 [Candidatus Peregrinibacteria bacterium]|nr:hypothetical protein [Candidatus Peregrinibacteria bacterium]